jgi:putative ABC transport system ATP-binding protein
MATPILSVDQLCKHASLTSGPLTILDNVSFSLPKASALAIVGASGSGKSTLLALLAGLDTPTTGEVYLAGNRLSTLTEDQRAQLRAQQVGFVFQSFQLLPALSALENVMLPLELVGLTKAKSQATHLLESVGLGQRLHHLPKLLSGGEQQRVAIARAFAASPSLLFADEPTGSLDTHTGQQIIELLFQMNQQKGTTLVLVTHDEGLAAKCNYQLRLDAGQVQAWRAPQ